MEMPTDDQPPEEIWLDDEAISDHFDRLREKYASGNSEGWQSVPASDESTTENALVKKMRGGR
jgi:hypothetical protein